MVANALLTIYNLSKELMNMILQEKLQMLRKKNGDYTYHCKVEGEFVWFQGYEEIFYQKEKIYECYFHGGRIS